MREELLKLSHWHMKSAGHGTLTDINLLLRAGECVSVSGSENSGRKLLAEMFDGKGVFVSGAAWVCGYDHEQSMVVTAHGFAMPVKEAFAPLLKLRHWLNPVRLVPGWQSASAPALLRGIALVELAVLVVIVISRGA